MFDEMTFKSKVTHEQAEHIIDKLYLQECTRGEAVYWQSSAYGKFDAVHAIIMDGKLTMRFSCHKLWSKWAGEGLDNSRPFSMTDELATIYKMNATKFERFLRKFAKLNERGVIRIGATSSKMLAWLDANA